MAKGVDTLGLGLGVSHAAHFSTSGLFCIKQVYSLWLRARLHQASASTLRQISDDACKSVLIENNGVALKWGCNLFSRNSTDFNENRMASVIAELSQG